MPAWPCPICFKGHTQLTAKSVHFEESSMSRRARDDNAWEPEWIELNFTAWGECSHSACKQRFAIAGKGGFETYYSEDGDDEVSEYFTPMYCNPMPRLIELPQKCPEEVKAELEAAFELFWINRNACSNRIRAAIERLMDHLRIPRRKKSKANKFYDLTLHDRLEIWSRRAKGVASHLMALKSLGNTGSHTGADVSREDLCDAFEIMEHSLQELIEARSARVSTLAKKLARKHA